MSESRGDPFEHYDAAYVFGSLDASDRSAFEAHLASCAACRARVEEARAITALLPADEDALGSVIVEEQPPDTLLPALLRQAQRERNRRRWTTGAIAGLAAACLVALVVVLWPTSGTSGAAPRALAPVGDTPVTATAVLKAKTWGTEIRLHCKYSSSDVPRLPYRLIVVDTDDRRHEAGSWRLVPGGTTNFTGGTEVARDHIARVQITLPNGKAILQLSP